MSKYDPLSRHLESSHGTVELGFNDIEDILKFPLPASARRHAAWWSNSGGTHVQSAAWQAAGYRTEGVDLEAETVRFVPAGTGFSEMKQAEFGAPKATMPGSDKPHPAFGALKGLITIKPGTDLTKPTFEDWKTLYDEIE